MFSNIFSLISSNKAVHYSCYLVVVSVFLLIYYKHWFTSVSIHGQHNYWHICKIKSLVKIELKLRYPFVQL